jgi:hypothetical protein
MATFMASAFTAPDRRKKVVTYGKTSRIGPVPTPASNNNNNDDAPSSPERPRKQTAVPSASLKKLGGLNSIGGRKDVSRNTTASPDIFDVPSEDEFAMTVTKKPLAKRRIPGKDNNAAPADDKAENISQHRGKVLETSHRAEPAKPVAPSTSKKSQKSAQPSKPPRKAPEPATAPPVWRRKTPQPTSVSEQDTVVKETMQRSVAKTKAVTQAPTQASPAIKIPILTKTNSALTVRSVAPKSSTKPSRDLDVFDMPSSDDESHVPTPKPTRRALPNIRNEPATKATKSSIGSHRKEQTESDDSTELRKRKRKGSISSLTAAKPAANEKIGPSLPQRSLKYQKKADGVAPGDDLPSVPTRKPATEIQASLAAISKPRRTRVRTVPVLTQPSAKVQSSPAILHSMLPERVVPKPLPITEVSEDAALDDDTMYEIPELMTTPLRPSPNTVSGSVTPRQKALFGSLLGTSSATPSMPSISKLQLTDTKPRSLLGALSRSKSELTPSATFKKAKLITSLKHAERSSDDEGSGSESESGSEAIVTPPIVKEKRKDKLIEHASAPRDSGASEDIDMEIETAVHSQGSQTTSGFGMRQRLTYAKARSYLEEANPEDAFLMAMDMDADEPMGPASQTRDSQTEEEEETSQVRANHELKRQGQNSKFEWENLMLIDDISGKSTNSIRRSALLELCTKMADTSFAHELLDSSLAQQFLNNLISKGEIIFDFAAAVATIFMLQANPTYTMLDQIHHSEHVSSLEKLLDNEMDVQRIAKNRKTNLSKIALDAVVAFRSTVLGSRIWTPVRPDTVSPQLIAVKALELLVLGLRGAGSMDSIISPNTLVKLVEITLRASEHCKVDNRSSDGEMILHSIFSTLEAVSLAKQKPLIWSARSMQSLAGSMSCMFQTGNAPTVTIAVKLCMNLTNNKPKACQEFSESTFVRTLLQSIINRMKLLQGVLDEAQRIESLDTLILSLGAMINLTEHSNQARRNADDGEHLLETLVQTFVEGSARTIQVSDLNGPVQGMYANVIKAVSMEESQTSVAVGYLSVLLGNLCLNEAIRTQVRAHLPGHDLSTLVDQIKEFVQVHEHANRKAKQYEGDEGQETWQNYTARIMLVAEELEKVET